MNNVLGQIQDILAEQTYECVFIAACEEYPFNRLLVLLGIDSKEREQTLEIREYQQLLDLGVSDSENTNLFSHLQFKMLFPFKVSDLANNDLSALIHFINHSSSFPGFEFDELNGEVIFRYVGIFSSKALNAFTIKYLFQCIQFNLTLFSDLLEQVATGNSTFNEILSDIIKKFEENIPSHLN